MLTAQALKTQLHREDLTQKHKLLLILAAHPESPMSPAEIRQAALQAGLRRAKKWNIGSILGRGETLAIRIDGSWELNDDGEAHVGQLVPLATNRRATVAAGDLRKHLASIKNSDTAAFVEESIACFESKLYRAAVVLSWSGAVSLLYDHVINHALGQFNAEALRRDSKWKSAKTRDDLARMKEYEFLNVLEAISILGKNVKQELQNACLQLRNACGHPSSLKIGENRVASHIEILILNVFAVF